MRTMLALALLAAACAEPRVSSPGRPGGDGGSAGSEASGGSGGTGGSGGQAAACGEVPSPDQLDLAQPQTLAGKFGDRVALAGAGARLVLAAEVTEGVDLGDGKPFAPDGLDDAVVAAYDAAGGAPAWIRVFASPTEDRIDSMAAAPEGDVFVSYTTAWDRFPVTSHIARLAAGDGSSRFDIEGTAASIAYQGGSLYTATLCMADGTDHPLDCIQKRNPDTGAVLWEKRFGGDYPGGAPHVTADLDGNVVVWGQTGAKGTPVDFGDGKLVYGSTGFGFVISLDSGTGTLRWKLPLVSREGIFLNSGVEAMSVAPDGTLLAVGSFNQTLILGRFMVSAGDLTESGLLMRLNAASGDVVWATAYPDAVFPGGVAALAVDGHLLLAGEMEGARTLGGLPVSAPADGYAALLADVSMKDGTFVSVRAVATAPSIMVNSLVPGCDGSLHLAADFMGALTVSGRQEPGDPTFTDGLLLDLHR